MIRRPPRSTLSSSSAASDVYKRQVSTQSTGGLADCMSKLHPHAQEFVPPPSNHVTALSMEASAEAGPPEGQPPPCTTPLEVLLPLAQADDAQRFGNELYHLLERGGQYRPVCKVLRQVLLQTPCTDRFVVVATQQLAAIGATMASFRVLLDVYLEVVLEEGVAPSQDARCAAAKIMPHVAPMVAVLVVKSFQLREHRQPGASEEDLLAIVFGYISSGDAAGAAVFAIGLSLQPLIPEEVACNQILRPLLHSQIYTAERYAKSYPPIQPALVEMLLASTKDSGKAAAKMAGRFHIPLSQIPGLELCRQRASLMWALRKQVRTGAVLVADHRISQHGRT
eukprot:TRINITY_DN24281_c0_g1_i4.p1 TRINITY_DN24281_c0_g1~~TRINITY_DN24281_c0_g1_i4.p1  ORF type:complete len:338 (+),score=93.65 TRINITY_DN24281_c0_g1_i4:140-1153(+)